MSKLTPNEQFQAAADPVGWLVCVERTGSKDTRAAHVIAIGLDPGFVQAHLYQCGNVAPFWVKRSDCLGTTPPKR